MLIATKAWSDFGAHIPLIRSFSLGANWPPQYPLFPGQPIRYHFLFYFLVGMLEKAGLRIDWALNIPSALGFFLLVYMVYKLGTFLFADKRVGMLAVLFFLFNGNLTFVRFFRQFPINFASLGQIMRNVHFVSFAPWGQGDISAFWSLNIYTNQRHLALAFGLALLVVYLFLKLETVSVRKQMFWAPVLAILLGIFPYFHQPTLLIVGICMGWYFLVFPRLRWFLLLTGILAGLLIAPQVFLLSQGPKLIAWYPGYLIHDALSIPRFFSYWWQNLGLHSVLYAIGFLVAPVWMKKALFPIFIIFAVANLFKFSPEVAASHKFFNFFLILGNILSAYALIRLFHRIRSMSSHWLIGVSAYWIIGLFLFFLTFSGIIDFFPIYNDPIGPLPDKPTNKMANWILHNTPPESIVLNSSFFYNPASLAGRKIFLGWPYFAWSAGYDTYKRMDQQKHVLEAPDTESLCLFLSRYNIDYILLEKPQSQQEFSPNVAVYQQSLPLLHEDTLNNTLYSLYGGKSFCTL